VEHPGDGRDPFRYGVDHLPTMPMRRRGERYEDLFLAVSITE
jgi:hypothetical protein